MRIGLSFFILFFAVNGLSAQATPATSPEAEQEARARFQVGRELVETNMYREARAEFQRGFELSQRPLFLFNMAECARFLGQQDDARREYSEYLRMEPTGDFAALANERLEDLPPGDNHTPGFVARLRMQAPAPDLDQVEAPGAGEPGGADAAVLEPDVAEESPDVPEASAPSSALRGAGIATLAVSGAALVSAVVSGVMTLSLRADLDEQGCAVSGCKPDEVDSLVRRALTFDVSVGISFAALTTGIILLLLRPKSSEGISVSPVANIGEDGLINGGVTVQGAF